MQRKRKGTTFFHFFFFSVPMACSSKITPFVTFLLLLVSYPTTIFSDLASDREALLAFYSAVGSRSVVWRNMDFNNNPCTWTGVGCNPDNSTVLELHLPVMGLSGPIPPNTISNLTNLQTLSLRYNSLSGPFPPDVSKLFRLRNLFLRHNFFTGPLPDSIFSLTSLVRLDISENNLSGPISSGFNNLTRLGTLNLHDNGFSGPLPDLNLPGLVVFNVSSNNLTGPIPKGIALKYPKGAFEGNQLCGEPLNDLCDNGVKNGSTNGNVNGKQGHGLSRTVIAGIVIGIVVGLLVLVIILWLLCRKRDEKEGGLEEVDRVKDWQIEVPRQRAIQSVEKQVPKGGSVNDDDNQLVFYKRGEGFELEDLLKASAEVLGRGSLGAYYKVILKVGIDVAVKRLLTDVVVSEEEFRLKMDEIGVMDHQNLVPLLAYLYNGKEKLLVYDYLPVGSLSSLLHDGRTPLNWESRLAIALGAAHGISYLHSFGPLVSHGNIKSSNILLTATCEARLADYCIAQLVSPSATPNRAADYRAPEVEDVRNVSQEADIYSFGVLLLELMTGRVPIGLPRWIHSLDREKWTAEVFDPELLRYQNVEEDMVQLLQLAVDCTAQVPDTRPLMSRVTSRIQQLYNSSLEGRTFDIRDG